MDESVVLGVESESTLVRETIEAYRDVLAEETRAEQVVTDTRGMDATNEWSLGDTSVLVGVRRLRQAQTT
ncbi:hypothetical protein RBH26_00075 [Natronolimnohabitans sp. A-GB9]|uniref:hypothetical protein n=1 Tax=Natronolimnohabitans sp. A-GB9 TaxID=3069757 RepID=UPI0027AE06A7|nr:hypothetical protein [Natronolimnohabitans sp. A-GB9]MDQ2048874.1 hypothetical protein [Natronolimnohabitans sp. A-GB9]